MTTRGNNRSHSGFTLIELMIGLVIISILAAVAYPAYTDHVKRGYHSEALGVITAISAALEVYAAASSQGNYSGASIAALYDPADKHAVTDVYDFELNPASPAASYSIQAVPKTAGPLANEGPIIIYWDGRKGWDSDNDGTYEVIDF